MRRPVVHEGEMQIYFGRADDTPRGEHELCVVCDPAITGKAKELFMAILDELHRSEKYGFDITTIRFKIQVRKSGKGDDASEEGE